MFSLQKLLGKEDKLFTLLEAGAEEARASVQGLVKLNQDLAQATRTEDSAYGRLKHRQITEEITEAVYTTFITAIQPEDILALSDALYRIPKAVDKFIERALLAPRYVQGVDFTKQISLLAAASDIVPQLVRSLRGGMNPRHIKELIDKLQSLETQADKLMPPLYRDLFSGRYEAVQAIFLKDLYELLEKAIDRCRSAGNVIARVVLKNS